jgi:translation initiation factor 1 (eIF-1/SUI1)
LLDDLIKFIVHAKAKGTEELFSFRKANGDRMVLIGRSVREEAKSTCLLYGLDAWYFSAHSLRKAAITHMRAQGTTVDDQSVGLGPLGSISLQGGRKPNVKDVDRLLPAKRRSL